MQTLRSDLPEQYHECVPLGWNPVPADGRYYYPGYTSEYREEGVWLHPAWLGSIPITELSDPNVRTSYEVLSALVRAGMVVKRRIKSAFYYRLTMRAIPYYFEDSSFGNNPDHLPYLCYSSIVPNRLLAVRRKAGLLRAMFDWTATSAAGWSQDPVLRKHSVVLPPVSDPVVAVISDSAGWSHVTRLETTTLMLPRPVDPSAWP